MKRLNFNNPQQVKKSLIAIANGVYSGEIDSKTANVITYIAQTVLQSIRADEQQKQLDEQKRQLEQLEKDVQEMLKQ